LLKVGRFNRTKAQDHELGLFSSDEVSAAVAEDGEPENVPPSNAPLAGEELRNEVLQFPTNCPECNAPCETNMKVTGEALRRCH
jgi:zinc finger protein